MKRNFFHDLLALLYPNLCLICSENLLRSENYLCLTCLHKIPKTNYHQQEANPVGKKFWGKVPIFRATSFFFFQKGSNFQNILHSLKYKGEKEIGLALGEYAAADLLQSPDFMSIDMIVPVPLHPKKQQTRGYNQSEWIAKGLAKVMNKAIETTELQRIKEKTSQTKKSVYERYKNTEGIFKTKNLSAFEGKHILLVDDVITTGSTLEACAQALLEVRDVKISIFTLATA